MNLRPAFLVASLAPWLLGGCVSTSQQQAAFAPVQDDVANVSGQRVVWNQDAESDRLVDDASWRRLKEPLDANAAAQIALLNNPGLQAAFEEIGISQAQLVQAGLLHNPVFAASWRFPDVAPAITDAEYSVAADFLDLALKPLKEKMARQNLAATQARVTDQVLELCAQTKSAFYTYQADLQLGERLKLVVQADQAGADLANDQHQSGNLNELGQLNQQAQLASAQMALTDGKKETISAREKLNRLMGLSGAAITWSARPSLPPLPPGDPGTANLEDRAIAERRDLLALREETDAVGQALALKSNTRFLPASIQVGADTEREEDRRITGPTVELELPIFDQGQGAVAQLAAQHRQLQRRLQQLAIEIRSEVREASRRLFLDRQQVAYFRETVMPVSVKSVNQTMMQFNAMQVNTYELFLAKQRELEAERDYVGTWRDYWVDRTDLERAVGGNLYERNP